MIRNRQSVEVYAREIGKHSTLRLFLEARLYACRYEQTSRLPEALYFAPHFGQDAARVYPGIRVGISHIARIETVEVVDSWDALERLVIELRQRKWLVHHRALLKENCARWPKAVKHSVLLLGAPRLVFNPPVRKETLQKGRGWLSKKFLSFDELFMAWGGIE
jgi:hypothetical protein